MIHTRTDTIKVRVIDHGSDKARLGIEADPGVFVFRKELIDSGAVVPMATIWGVVPTGEPTW